MPDPKTYSENELLMRVAAGDEKAFEQLFHQYRPTIYSYVVHIADIASANEVVQDVFLKVWNYRQRLHEVQSFPAWLTTMAKNRVFDELKRMAREKVVLQKYSSNQPDVQYNEVMPLTEIKDNHRLLEQVLQVLSPQQREVFRLSREQGMTYEQIAEKLQISRNTVKAHMVNALERIRLALKDHPDFSALLVLITLQGYL